MSVPSNMAITQQIEAISSFIEAAQGLVYKSTIVDVTDIEQKIVDLCLSVEKLPPNQTKNILPLIEKLFQSMDQLEKDLDLQHDALTERLRLNETHANPLMAQEVVDDERDD